MKQRKRISLDWLDRGRTALEPLLALTYPRHCPLCGTVLEQSAWKAAVCRSVYRKPSVCGIFHRVCL